MNIKYLNEKLVAILKQGFIYNVMLTKAIFLPSHELQNLSQFNKNLTLYLSINKPKNVSN